MLWVISTAAKPEEKSKMKKMNKKKKQGGERVRFSPTWEVWVHEGCHAAADAALFPFPSFSFGVGKPKHVDKSPTAERSWGDIAMRARGPGPRTKDGGDQEKLRLKWRESE